VPTLDVRESWTRAAAAPTMVLATVSSDGSPHLVPICSVIIGQCVYFAIDEIKPKATQRLVRLGNIEAEPRVSVLASHYEDDWSRLWWVRVDGVAHEVQQDQRSMALDALARKYPQYARHPPTGPVVEIVATAIRGWCASVDAGAA